MEVGQDLPSPGGLEQHSKDSNNNIMAPDGRSEEKAVEPDNVVDLTPDVSDSILDSNVNVQPDGGKKRKSVGKSSRGYNRKLLSTELSRR